MEILLGNLFIVYVSSFFARLNLKTKTLETDYKNYNKIFILIAMISLIVVSGFRYKSGTDFMTYTEIFQITANSTTLDLENGTDIGFTIFCKWLSTISMDPQIMFLASAIVTNVLIVLVLSKYSRRFELSMWLYINTFVYYSTFNGLRQWIVAAIIFTSIKYLIYERNFKKYLPIILFASLFHASVLVMIPVYFIINSKTFSIRNLFMIIGFILAVFLYGKFLDILGVILAGTQYEHYIDIFNSDRNGIHPLRLAVYFAPIGVTCLYYKILNPSEDKTVDRLINLCIIGFLIMFIALRHVFFARLVFYFDLYYLLLIPKLIDIGDKKFKRWFYYTISVGYFAFSYSLLNTGEGWILPYTLKITLF